MGDPHRNGQPTQSSRSEPLSLDRKRSPPLGSRAVGPDPQLDAVIAAVPEWRGHEPEITAVEAGRTNRNYRVEVGSGTFFLRLSHEDTALLGIDRAAGLGGKPGPRGAGVGPEVVGHLAEHRWLVTGWVPGEPLGEGDMEQ